MAERKIVSKHLLRSRARAERRYVEHLWIRSAHGSSTAALELRERGLTHMKHLHIEPAGRIRARWQLVAE